MKAVLRLFSDPCVHVVTMGTVIACLAICYRSEDVIHAAEEPILSQSALETMRSHPPESVAASHSNLNAEAAPAATVTR